MTKGREGNHAPLLRGSDAPRAIYRLKVESGLLPGRYTLQTARALALAALTRAGVLVVVVPEGSTWFVALKVTDWYRRGYSPAYIAKRLDVSERYVWKLIRAYDKSDDDVREAWKRGDVGVITVLRSIDEVA